MSEWKPIYLCWRPDTKSKEKHAACRQYVFETEAALKKWLRARRNSEERIIVCACPTSYVRDETRIKGTRKELAARESWPPLT